MRRIITLALAFAPVVAHAQADQEKSRSVSGGGISVAGWQGKIDAREAGQGMTINDAKFAPMGKGMHITTGPATTYWNPANKVSGDYKVSATFDEAHVISAWETLLNAAPSLSARAELDPRDETRPSI